MVCMLREDVQDVLMQVQDKLAGLLNSPGGLSFNKFRSFRGFRDHIPGSTEAMECPQRFVDGEMIENFLSCDEDIQRQAAEDTGFTVSQITNMAEELSNLK